MTEKAPIKYVEPTKEKGLIIWPEKVALHARLLLSQNALNPENTTITQVEQTQLGTWETQDYSLFNKSSFSVREQCYKTSPDLKVVKEKWSNDFVSKITSAQQFFTHTDDGARWARFLSALGIHTESISKYEVDSFFQHYLQGDEKEGQIKTFVGDVINFHRSDDGTIDLDKLNKNSDVIDWIAHAFGNTAVVDMVRELVMAESRLATQKDEFIQAINSSTSANKKVRINTLYPIEKTTLTRIWETVKPFVYEEKKATQAENTQKQETKKVVFENTTKTDPLLKEASPQVNESSAVFTNETKRLFVNCGINPDHVNPIPIGKGANHTVFSYNIPHQEKQVIKIPNPKSVGTLTKGMIEEDANITTVVKAFPQFAIPTSVKKDSQSNQYCVVQQAVEGAPLTQLNCTPELKKQLQDIIALNHRLIDTQQISLDFVGMPGFFTWINRQIHRHGPFEVSNIMIDKQGRLRIIDYDIFSFNHGTSLRHKVASRIGFLANRFFMHHYFDVDIKKPKEKASKLHAIGQPH